MSTHIPGDVLPDGTAATGHSDYDALPRAVKDLHPLDGWLWLTSEQKTGLTQTETEPEPEF